MGNIEFQYDFPEEVEEDRAALRSLIQQSLDGNTLSAIQTAQDQLQAWLRNHPEDLVMWDAGEPLAMTEDALLAAEPSPVLMPSS